MRLENVVVATKLVKAIRTRKSVWYVHHFAVMQLLEPGKDHIYIHQHPYPRRYIVLHKISIYCSVVAWGWCVKVKKKRSKERYSQNCLELLNCGATPPRERETEKGGRNEHTQKRGRGKECKRESKWAKERDTALCISIFSPGALILYMLHYALLFICRDIDVSHELAGCVCVCERDRQTHLYRQMEEMK